MSKKNLKKKIEKLEQEVSKLMWKNAGLERDAERLKEKQRCIHANNQSLRDRNAELLEECVKDSPRTEVAQLRLTKDDDQVVGFTIHAVNEEDISVINTVRNRIFYGGTPNVEYSGRKEATDTHAGILQFKFKNLDFQND